MVVVGNGKTNNSIKKKVICWKCGQSRHVKKNCQGGWVGSVSSFKSVNRDTYNDVNIVYLSIKDNVF